MTTLSKHPEETRLYAFDFAQQREITAGQTLASALALSSTRLEGSGSLTIGTPAINGTRLEFTIAGGALGDRYEILCTVTTSAAATLAGAGRLKIERS
jgi:hypothetical protein